MLQHYELWVISFGKVCKKRSIAEFPREDSKWALKMSALISRIFSGSIFVQWEEVKTRRPSEYVILCTYMIHSLPLNSSNALQERPGTSLGRTAVHSAQERES